VDKTLSQTQWSEFLSDLRRVLAMVPNELYARSARNLLSTSLMRILQEDTTDVTAVVQMITVKPDPRGMLVTLALPASYIETGALQLRTSQEVIDLGGHAHNHTDAETVTVTLAKFGFEMPGDA